ncbi:MAG: hypothetical protein ACO1TE_29655 [Prosthecobacter sp.]
MKLQHHLTSLLLAIVFTSGLSAATLPQIKTASSKVPAAPRVVKVPVAPKIPTIAKVPGAPKVPVVKVPGVAKVPAAPKVVAAPKVPVMKAAAAAKIPNVALKAGSAINTGRLNNLKQKVQIDSSRFTAVGGKGGRFISDNLGNAAATKRPGSLVDGLKQGASTAGEGRNPLSGNPLDGMRGGRNGQMSDDGSKKSSTVNFSTTVKNKDGSESTHYPDGTEMRSYPNGTVIYTDEKGKQHYMPGKGVAAPFVPNTPMMGGSSDPVRRATVNGSTAKTPTPDGEDSGGTAVVTKDTIRGILARKNSTSEPAQGEGGSSGGPVNTGANGTGKSGSLSQPVADSIGNGSVSVDAALETIRVKVESKINTGR